MSARNQSEESLVCYIFFDEGTLSEEERARLPAPVGTDEVGRIKMEWSYKE